MRHVLWAIAWMGLGLLITLAAASVLQKNAINQRETVHAPRPAPRIEPLPPVKPAPGPRVRPSEPGRSVLLVSGRSDDQ
jgi:hypothetical protein